MCLERREEKLAEEITMKKIYDFTATINGPYGLLFNLGGLYSISDKEYRVKTFELNEEENQKLNEQYGDGETKYRIVLAFENDKVMKDKVQILNVTEVAAYTKPYEEIAALIDLNKNE